MQDEGLSAGRPLAAKMPSTASASSPLPQPIHRFRREHHQPTALDDRRRPVDHIRRRMIRSTAITSVCMPFPRPIS